jgi:hypothetical protein
MAILPVVHPKDHKQPSMMTPINAIASNGTYGTVRRPAVEPTRSQNMTLSCRRSASCGFDAVAPGAWGATAGPCASSEIARSILRRSPSTTLRSSKSWSVRSGRTLRSMRFSVTLLLLQLCVRKLQLLRSKLRVVKGVHARDLVRRSAPRLRLSARESRDAANIAKLARARGPANH